MQSNDNNRLHEQLVQFIALVEKETSSLNDIVWMIYIIWM